MAKKRYTKLEIAKALASSSFLLKCYDTEQLEHARYEILKIEYDEKQNDVEKVLEVLSKIHERRSNIQKSIEIIDELFRRYTAKPKTSKKKSPAKKKSTPKKK